MVYKNKKMQRKFQRDYKWAQRHGQKFRNPFKSGTWRGPNTKTSEWHRRLNGKKHANWTDVGKELLTPKRVRLGIRLGPDGHYYHVVPKMMKNYRPRRTKRRNAIRGSF